jgi:hypothetical protein
VAVTVKLNARGERTLNALAKRRGLSRSDVVREALAHYDAEIAGATAATRPYDAWVDVIGVVSLGARNPALTTGEQFAAAIAPRVRTRRAR